MASQTVQSELNLFSDGGVAENLTIEEQCIQFGSILGLDEPVAERVLSAALHSPSYATNLLVSRESPVFLTQLLANPPAAPAPDLSAAELMKHAAEALWRWSKAGFTRVDDKVLERRLSACEACPNLAAPPEARKRLYALAGTAAGSRSICRLCGCPVARKAAMAFEACPDPDPERPGLSRWGEKAVSRN